MRRYNSDALARGPGPRLFPEQAAPAKLSLAACESYDNGVVYLAYRPQACGRRIGKATTADGDEQHRGPARAGAFTLLSRDA